MITLTGCGLFAGLVSRNAFAYEIVSVSNGGSVSGFIRLDGELPDEETTIISKENHVCGHGHNVMNPVSVDDNKGVASAVVSIEGITAGKEWSKEHELRIEQEKCQFMPYVQVGPSDGELTIHNKDPLLHNIHTYEIIGRARRTLFNIAQPSAGQTDNKTLKLRRGNVVQVACDAHNWMNAWIYTSDNPYLSVSSTTGAFNIDSIPAGTYRMKVWHPTLGEKFTDITVEAGANTQIDVALTGVG